LLEGKKVKGQGREPVNRKKEGAKKKEIRTEGEIRGCGGVLKGEREDPLYIWTEFGEVLWGRG